ncbi:hypothetical protein DID88_009400 [Monilinia fructigena]|uniref:Rab-GAP TBC domain-containing protein n=1 Tax=Monilinia fructigena TaxID=38457 RepID=A0A395IMW1_9HELO|nr:hypothetical protein DID88_009400 [Monilinia fructigena]
MIQREILVLRPRQPPPPPPTARTSTITIPTQGREGDQERSIVNLVNTDNVNVNVLGININFDSKLIMANTDTSSTPQTQLSHVQSPASYNNPSSFMKNESLPSSTGPLKRWRAKNSNSQTPTGTGKSTEIPEEDFSPITTPIPSENILEDDFMQSMSFSKRGSMMLSGRKAVNGQARINATRRQPSFSMLATTSSPSTKVLSDDLEMESQKVRSMYESGSGFDWRDGEDDTIDNRLTAGGQSIPERPVTANSYLTANGIGVPQRCSSALSSKRPAELAGGIEDWEDVNGKDVDRYGFINNIAEEAEGGKGAELMKRKESERTEKWRRMAKIIKGKDGEGMDFEFDTKNSKLIERTWKGIPDRWRSAAWYSFLATSAKKREGSAQEKDIIQTFHKLQDQSSADDVQIDLDVPRTINSHIMFRRRYRGGQRLLFRVLHALSLYFPTTGYVQGMASLAATLLCYYDEEKCFVMLVHNGEVSAKLNELGIEPTAYCTRWYLTLFNYSIPFPAQLRVWDVFMLLGDEDQSLPYTKDRPFAGGLDIIHATSAALIDGTRDILLDSDFESSMKVLTSWIPVKDEELLMKVTKAEWKLHRGKKRN